MSRVIQMGDYSPVGDLVVVSVCWVMIVLMLFSYIRKSKSFRIFLALIGVLMVAALTDVTFHSLAASGKPALYGYAYALRCVFHALLFSIFVLFAVYIAETARLERRKRTPFMIAAALIFCVVVTVDVLDTVQGRGIQITNGGIQARGRNVFFPGYVAFVILLCIMLANVRNRLYNKVMRGFYGTIAIAFFVQFIQGRHGQTSFTVATFLYPIIAMFYTLHANPYDAQLGAMDNRALLDTVKRWRETGWDFVFMSLYLRSYDEEGKRLPEDLQDLIRKFVASYFKGAMLFQGGSGHVVLLVQERLNPDYEARIRRILEAFYIEYGKRKIDYKIVIGHGVDEISRKGEYISFIRSIHRRIPENTVHRVDEEDIERFNQTEFILRELEDIYRKRDPDDPRVLAFCQPVYNLQTREYDTAEALMRLKLEGMGLVTPDRFIPLAEKYGYIHVLTEIILHKACEAVRRLTEAGYRVGRVSVNVSVLELKDAHFCEDITRIIEASGVNGDRIAIELTESRTDSDFMLMKRKISELKQKGIKFYLDDFGTGYSNMERIMELPFDIIKFDRSMVLASESSERSRKLVVSLANMFSELRYAVLYEGIENDSDEEMCAHMAASYLQGYKYSRPVPIETLKDYFSKRGNGAA